MLVTLFTDAGLCPETHSSSWAAWCKSERGVSRSGGITKTKMPNSNAAESAAAVNGVYHAIASGIARRGDTILIQTDNSNVQNFLTMPIKSHYKAKAERRQMQEVFASIRSKHEIIVRFRHVKGHNGTKDKRSAINTWCDKVCTFFLKMARHEAMPEKWGPVNLDAAPYGVRIYV